MTQSIPPAAPSTVADLTTSDSGERVLITTAMVRGIIERALEVARRAHIEATSKQQLHAARSRDFVAALGDQFASLYGGDQDIRVFTKHDERNRAEFGMNELLYDVTVCRTSTVKSARHGKMLHYVASPIWHVESELARSSRQALFDFNKLVLGAASLNLFVGPYVHEPSKFVDVLRVPAGCCAGRVFVALIPHPGSWEETASDMFCEELS